MSKYTKPQKFTPSQKDLGRVGREIAKILSADKVVVAGTEKFQGSKPCPIEESEPLVLRPDPVFYNGKEISDEVLILKDDEMIAINLSDGSFEINALMIPLIDKVTEALNLSSIDDLINVSEKVFFNAFTPLMNEHYNLRQS